MTAYLSIREYGVRGLRMIGRAGEPYCCLRILFSLYDKKVIPNNLQEYVSQSMAEKRTIPFDTLIYIGEMS